MLYVVISRAGSYELSRNNINSSHGFYGIENFTKAATVSIHRNMNMIISYINPLNSH